MKISNLKNRPIVKESKPVYKIQVKETITEDIPRNYKKVFTEEKRSLFFKWLIFHIF